MVWVLGLSLGSDLGWPFWLIAKLVIVTGLTGYHGWAVGVSRKMAAGQRPVSERTLRLANEIPSLATIAIVLLVIIKPF